jgi:hypothetical protein
MQLGRAGSPALELPLSAPWRAQLLDAVIFAAALVARRQHMPSAARMCLLRELGGLGLTAPLPFHGPTPDVMARFSMCLQQVTDPRRARRLLSQQMSPFVGTPWASIILDVAESVKQACDQDEERPETSAVPLRALRLSLGLCWPTDCSPPPRS